MAAYEIHRKHNIVDFPIDIIALLEGYPDIKIITYREMAKKQKLSIEDIVFANSSTDGSIHYSADRDKYMISFNDEIKVKGRVYWTLAHEFGHYCLGHLKDTPAASLSRMDVTDEEYASLEREADFFARFLINPPSIIKDFNPVNYQKVMDVFKVTYSAANNTIDYLNRIWNAGWMVGLPPDMKEHFSPFMQKVKWGRTCGNCHSFFIHENAKFCLTCRSTNIPIYYLGVEQLMEYPGIATSNNGKAEICPRCENEETHHNGDHCLICGIYIQNKCTRIEYDMNGNVTETCLEVLPGNARFCPECGTESTFNENNLLKSWEEAKQEIERQMDALPF